jgi:hypothetical protein
LKTQINHTTDPFFHKFFPGIENNSLNCSNFTDSPKLRNNFELCSNDVGCNYLLHGHMYRIKANYCKKIDFISKVFSEKSGNYFTPYNLFNSSLADGMEVDRFPEIKKIASTINENLSKIRNIIIIGEDSKKWIFYGEVKNNLPNGWGTKIDSDGNISRGLFTNGNIIMNTGEYINSFKTRGVFERITGNKFGTDGDGLGSWFNSSKQGYIGIWKNGTLINGKFYDNNIMVEEGLYRNDNSDWELYKGNLYNRKTGLFEKSINLENHSQLNDGKQK